MEALILTIEIVLFCIFCLILLILIFAVMVSCIRNRRRLSVFLSANPTYGKAVILSRAYGHYFRITIFAVNGEPPAFRRGYLLLPAGEVTILADYASSDFYRGLPQGPIGEKRFLFRLFSVDPQVGRLCDAKKPYELRWNVASGTEYIIKADPFHPLMQVIADNGEDHSVMDFTK